MDSIINLFLNAIEGKDDKLRYILYLIYTYISYIIIAFWLSEQIGFVYDRKEISIERVIYFISSGTIVYPLLILFFTILLCKFIPELIIIFFGYIIGLIFKWKYKILLKYYILLDILNSDYTEDDDYKEFIIFIGDSTKRKNDLEIYYKIVSLFCMQLFIFEELVRGRYFNIYFENGFYTGIIMLVILTILYVASMKAFDYNQKYSIDILIKHRIQIVNNNP